MLAAAARTGNAAAFAAFSAVLGWAKSRSAAGQEWRAVFWASAAAQTVPLILLSVFGRDRTDETGGEGGAASLKKTASIRESLGVLRREACTPLFWLHMASRSSLMVYASFLLFVPSFMANCFGMTGSEAARVGSVYAIGCLTAVTLGSDRYGRLRRGWRAIADLIQLGSATGCALLLLGHVSGRIVLSPAVGSFLMFVWGASFAIPFYIPPSLYALGRGGRESSATIADAFDVGGFSLLAAFNGYVAGIQQNVMSEWTMAFVVLTACSITSMASLVTASIIDDSLKT